MEFYRFKDIKSCAHIPHAKDIYDFVEKADCSKLTTGEIRINGEELFVRVGEYETEPQERKNFETHRIYADVQYIVSGIEVVDFTTETPLSPLSEYDARSDIQFFRPPARFSQLVVSAGECVVFFPREAHRPGCIYQTPSQVKKLVFKIKV